MCVSLAIGFRRGALASETVQELMFEHPFCPAVTS
jgi:hypothetical protein